MPIASRIEHGVVSVPTSACRRPDNRDGELPSARPPQACTAVPERLLGAYIDPAYPNRLVVQVPPSSRATSTVHNLTFWNAIAWPTGSYQFDYVVDPANAVGETNEGNNTPARAAP
ncbi:MAG: CARDB domain-containing protein [Hyphomonadaceae bacterium]